MMCAPGPNPWANMNAPSIRMPAVTTAVPDGSPMRPSAVMATNWIAKPSVIIGQAPRVDPQRMPSSPLVRAKTRFSAKWDAIVVSGPWVISVAMMIGSPNATAL